MKAKVIKDKCVGCGQCAATCDSVFEIKDDGYAAVITDKIEENLKEDVEMAASGCPTDAIEIENA